MFNKKDRYGVRGTEGNVNKAIDEQEKTNRAEIDANKEIGLMEWQVKSKKDEMESNANKEFGLMERNVNLKKVEMESNTEMARITKGNEERMKQIEIDQTIKLTEIGQNLTAEHKFENEMAKIKGTNAANMEGLKNQHHQNELSHHERMELMKFQHEDKKLQHEERLSIIDKSHEQRITGMTMSHDQTMGAMKFKGEFALTALKKAKGSFRMKNTALSFQLSNQQQKKWMPNMIESDENLGIENENEDPRPAVPEETEAADLYNEFEIELDTEMEKEFEKMKHQRETMKHEREMEKMQGERVKNELAAKKIDFMAQRKNDA